VVHGERTASEALADKIRTRFNLETHIPKWKQQLILKPKETAYEELPAEEAASDTQTMILNNIVDLENALKELRKRAETKGMEEGINEEALDRMKYIQEELQEVLSNG
jgi:metallo-beta-lactamase family protein